MSDVQLIQGDCLSVLRTFDANSIHCCITSPPYYGLRDYGVDGQFGLEKTPEEYVSRLVEVFREVRRILHDDGTLWLNLGDTYASGETGRHDGYNRGRNSKLPPKTAGMLAHSGCKGIGPKQLLGIPWRVAFALQADGWVLRSDIIWHKPNPMPESVRDRPTKAHEYLFLLAKSERYYYDQEAIKESAVSAGQARGGGKKLPENACFAHRSDTQRLSSYGVTPSKRNRRSVWTISTRPYKEAHFATFPPALVEPCVLAGCPEGGTVLDPFSGAATTGIVALKHGRHYRGIELNSAYHDIAMKRIEEAQAAAA